MPRAAAAGSTFTRVAIFKTGCRIEGALGGCHVCRAGYTIGFFLRQFASALAG